MTRESAPCTREPPTDRATTGLGSWRARRGRRMVRRPRRLQRHTDRGTSRAAGGPRRARCAGGGCAGRCPARSHRPRRGPGGRDRARGRARWCAPCERDGRRQRRLARGRLPAHGHRRGGTTPRPNHASFGDVTATRPKPWSCEGDMQVIRETSKKATRYQPSWFRWRHSHATWSSRCRASIALERTR
jgi:hypothetical protein